MKKKCERCGASTPHEDASAFSLFDYCAGCGKDLCDACMEKGCCGHVPARSGDLADNEPDEIALELAARARIDPA